MSKSKPISSSCPSSPISRSPTPPVSLSYSNWPRKRVLLAAPKKSPMVEPIPHVQEPYPSVSANQSAANDASENKPLQENIQNKGPIASPTIQHHVIKGRISPIMVVRKNFSAHQDLASQQLMDRQPIRPSSCPLSPNLASSAIPSGASASAPASTAISTRTARPSFARRTSAPSLLVSALVASHANSREKLSQDAGGPKITDQEKSSPRSSRIPVASLPTISVTTVVEIAPEAKLTISTKNIAKEGQSLRNKSCGAQLRPALKRSSTDPEGSSIQDPDGSSIQRKSVQFETKFERIRLFLEAETPHAVTLSPTRLGPVPKMDAGSIVLPNFPHLTTCYHSKPVSVESVSLSPDGTHILGLIQVQNLAYEKNVRARYTFDCWETAHEVVARYKEPIIPSDSNYRGLDRFEFSVPIPPRLDDSVDDDSEDVADMWRTMYMAVQYQVEGTQYWDSNSGQNYQINIRQPPPQQCFEEDRGGEEVDQGIFDLSDLGDDDSKENSPDFSSSPRRIPVAGKSIKTLSGSSAIPLRTVKKNLGNRYDFGASLAATVRPRSSPPSFLNSNPMYHRPSSPLSFSSFSSTSTLISSSSSQIGQIPTSSSKSSSPSSTSSSPNASPSITRPSPRPTIPSIPFMSSSSSVEAPISSTPWEERARTVAVSYCRPSSPSCDFTSNNPTSYDSSSFPGIPSAWTSYSPSGASSFDAIYSGSPTPQKYHQPYSPLSSPYSSSPPATAIWG